ncbi:MAG: hypothetical protein KGI60_03810, partial [Patescibacteria group bacterium]|nr:hypothetical protein [Patescibacteria group bacterium]
IKEVYIFSSRDKRKISFDISSQQLRGDNMDLQILGLQDRSFTSMHLIGSVNINSPKVFDVVAMSQEYCLAPDERKSGVSSPVCIEYMTAYRLSPGHEHKIVDHARIDYGIRL